jgi:hypothetical protein
MATRPKLGRPWPRNAEAMRRQSAEAAGDIRELAHAARDEVRDNPMLAEVMLADMAALASDIQRWLTEARIGVEPEGDD